MEHPQYAMSQPFSSHFTDGEVRGQHRVVDLFTQGQHLTETELGLKSRALPNSPWFLTFHPAPVHPTLHEEIWRREGTITPQDPSVLFKSLWQAEQCDQETPSQHMLPSELSRVVSLLSPTRGILWCLVFLTCVHLRELWSRTPSPHPTCHSQHHHLPKETQASDNHMVLCLLRSVRRRTGHLGVSRSNP